MAATAYAPRVRYAVVCVSGRLFSAVLGGDFPRSLHRYRAYPRRPSGISRFGIEDPQAGYRVPRAAGVAQAEASRGSTTPADTGAAERRDVTRGPRPHVDVTRRILTASGPSA